MASVGLSDAKLKIIIWYLATHLEDDWHHFMQIVGLSQTEIETIYIDHQSDILGQTKEAFYLAWKRLFFPSWKDIKKALVVLGRNDLVDIIKRDVFHTQDKQKKIGIVHKVEFIDEKLVFALHIDDEQLFRFKERLDRLTNISISIYQDIDCNVKHYFEKYFGNGNFYAFNTQINDSFILEFKEFLISNKPGFIVRGYDLDSHYGSFQLERYFPKSDYNNIWIGYESKNNCFYFIQICEGIDVEQIKKSVDAGTSYIQKFTMLYKNLLVDSSAALLAIVVVPNHAEHLISEIQCSDCQKFIITKQSFSNFSVLVEQFSEYIADRKEIKKVNFVESIANLIFSHIVQYMATETLICPLKPEGEKILLTPQQVAIKNSNSNRMIIQGCYGSGKTLVLQSRGKLIAKEDPMEEIYYINFNGSIERKEVKKYVNNTFINDNILNELLDLSLHNILSYICEYYKGKKVHVFLDEVPLHELTEEAASSIKSTTNLLHEKSNMWIATLGGFKTKFDKNLLNWNQNQQIRSFRTETLYENTRSIFPIYILLQTAIHVIMKAQTFWSERFRKRFQNTRKLPDLLLDLNVQKKKKYSPHREDCFSYFKNRSQLRNDQNGDEKPILFYFKRSNERIEVTLTKHLQCFQIIFEKFSPKVDNFVFLHFSENCSEDILHKLRVIAKLFQKDANDFFIIKSLSEVHGHEFDNVVIYYMIKKHANQNVNLVEAVSRCKQNIQFIVFEESFIGNESKHNILLKIFTRWVESNLVENIDLDKKVVHKPILENDHQLKIYHTNDKVLDYSQEMSFHTQERSSISKDIGSIGNMNPVQEKESSAVSELKCPISNECSHGFSSFRKEIFEYLTEDLYNWQEFNHALNLDKGSFHGEILHGNDDAIILHVEQISFCWKDIKQYLKDIKKYFENISNAIPKDHVHNLSKIKKNHLMKALSLVEFGRHNYRHTVVHIVVTILHGNNVDVNNADENEQISYHFLANNSLGEIFQSLLGKKACIDAQNIQQSSQTDNAAYNGHVHVFIIIDNHSSDNFGHKSQDFDAKYGSKEAVGDLILNIEVSRNMNLGRETDVGAVSELNHQLSNENRLIYHASGICNSAISRGTIVLYYMKMEASNGCLHAILPNRCNYISANISSEDKLKQFKTVIDEKQEDYADMFIVHTKYQNNAFKKLLCFDAYIADVLLDCQVKKTADQKAESISQFYDNAYNNPGLSYLQRF